jgi:hypothetical protein
MKHVMVLAGCLLLLPVLGDVSAQSAAAAKAGGRTRFVGTWKLLYRDTPGRGGGEAVHTIETGRLTYDDRGNMTVQVAREGREKLTAASDPQQQLSTYTAYWGTYVVDEAKGTMTHQIEGSLSPAMIGRPSPHRYEFSGDGQRLALTSPGSTSTWERIQ